MRQLWRPVVERITPYDAGKPLETLKRELGLDELIRLSANENPLGPSPRVVDAIRREASAVHLYPDGGSHRAAGCAQPPPPRAADARSSSATAPTSSSAWSRWPPSIPATRSWCRRRRSSPTPRSVTLAGARGATEPAGRLRDRPRRRAGAGHAPHQGGDPVLATQSGHHDHPAGAADEVPRGARSRSAAGRPRRGLPRLLRRPRLSQRDRAARPATRA